MVSECRPSRHGCKEAGGQRAPSALECPPAHTMWNTISDHRATHGTARTVQAIPIALVTLDGHDSERDGVGVDGLVTWMFGVLPEVRLT